MLPIQIYTRGVGVDVRAVTMFAQMYKKCTRAAIVLARAQIFCIRNTCIYQDRIFSLRCIYRRSRITRCRLLLLTLPSTERKRSERLSIPCMYMNPFSVKAFHDRNRRTLLRSTTFQYLHTMILYPSHQYSLRSYNFDNVGLRCC